MPARELIRDILSALGLLTRFPVNLTEAPAPRAAWAWPLAGLLVGLLAAGGGAFGLWLGLVPGVVAALVLAIEAAATGGLHEDGLADCADGFWGGRDKARRLEIMKDSRVGSYGVLALGIVLLARWAALTALIGTGQWGVIIAAAAMSRAPMAVLMAALPNARGSGLSASHGAPSAMVAAQAVGVALLAGLICGAPVLPMALAMAVATGAVAALAKAKIGGQTGDVLGAVQQMALVAGLAFA